MKIWLTTDTHFGHKQMLEYCGRPEDFSEILLKNLLSTVKQDDILIHLGDICIGNDVMWHEKLMEIKGKHWLVKGNHDSKSNTWYLEHGWDMVCEQFSDRYFGKRILFSHKPVAWDGEYEINIHGHFHNSNPNRHEQELVAIKNGYQKLLAVEYTDYKPVELKKFIRR
jgi:calcineurin-like phosphoesterase family protein